MWRNVTADLKCSGITMNEQSTINDLTSLETESMELSTQSELIVKLSRNFNSAPKIVQKIRKNTLTPKGKKKIRNKASNFQDYFFSMSCINGGNLKEFKMTCHPLDDLPWNDPYNLK